MIGCTFENLEVFWGALSKIPSGILRQTLGVEPQNVWVAKSTAFYADLRVEKVG
jgi:hypothetical protein